MIQSVQVVLITRKVFVIKKERKKEWKKTNANNEIYSHENALMVWYKSIRKKRSKLCKNQMKMFSSTIHKEKDEQQYEVTVGTQISIPIYLIIFFASQIKVIKSNANSH